MKRILAWAGILAAAAAFLALIVLAVTGAPANILMALVFVVMIVPVLIYGFLIFVKLKKDDRDKYGVAPLYPFSRPSATALSFRFLTVF